MIRRLLKNCGLKEWQSHNVNTTTYNQINFIFLNYFKLSLQPHSFSHNLHRGQEIARIQSLMSPDYRCFSCPLNRGPSLVVNSVPILNNFIFFTIIHVNSHTFTINQSCGCGNQRNFVHMLQQNYVT